jgi:archaellum component FlaC
MKTLKTSFVCLLILILLSLIITFESCQIVGKDLSIETVFGKFQAGEIEIGIATTLIQDVMKANPDKSKEIIKEICNIIKAYRQVSESYGHAAKSIEGISNLQSVKEQLETLSQHYGRLAKEYETLLLSKNIDCREYMQ